MKITDPFDQYDYLPCFSPRLAASLGKHCEGQAVLLHQIEFWLSRPKVGKIVTKCVDKKHRVVCNRKWVKEKLSDFAVQFPNTSKSTLRRILNSLLKKDLVIATNTINHAKFDRTTWYTVNFDKLWQIFKTSKYTDKIGEFKKYPKTPQDIKSAKQNIRKYQTPYQKGSQFPAPRKCSSWSHEDVKKNNSTDQNGHLQMSKVSRGSAQSGHHDKLTVPKSLSKSSNTLGARTHARNSKKTESNLNNSQKPLQPIRDQNNDPKLSGAMNRADILEQRDEKKHYDYQQYDSKIYDLFAKALADNVPQQVDTYAKTWFYQYRVDAKLVQVAITRTLDTKGDMEPHQFLSYVNSVLRNMSYQGYHTYRNYKAHNGKKSNNTGHTKIVYRAPKKKAAESPQPSDDNGKSSSLIRTAQVVHIQRTGNLDKETPTDNRYALLICKSDEIWSKETHVDIAHQDPQKKPDTVFEAAAKYLNNHQNKNKPYKADEIRHIASLNRKFYDF